MLLLEVTQQVGITGQTWFITLIGFGMVLLLLFVFIYVMKLMGKIMRPRVKAVKKEATNEEQTESVVHKQREDRIVLTGDATAAIALALHLYYNGVHDEEDTKITIQPHRTQWNNKMYGMNNLHR
ncbi:MAG: OadG family protein [Paludibacteraceae bacterium]|nr:OadG family protein [Paludibacteraceae bacterium]